MKTNFKNELAPAVIELNRMNEELQAENERLKAERNCAIMSRDMAWDENEKLRKENAKLKCLALHLFWKYTEKLMWTCDGMSQRATTSFIKDRLIRKTLMWEEIRNKCYNAYRKAKKSLMEGK